MVCGCWTDRLPELWTGPYKQTAEPWGLELEAACALCGHDLVFTTGLRGLGIVDYTARDLAGGRLYSEKRLAGNK